MYVSSFQSHRVVRSVLGEELYALAAAIDMAIILRRDINVALSHDIPVVVLSDSLGLFIVLIRTSTITT